MHNKKYMNKCPVCDEPFFCEHKRDVNCPYCHIEELKKASLFKSNRIASLVEDYTKLQRKLDRINKLPDNWRNRIILTHAHKCAEELERAMLEDDDE